MVWGLTALGKLPDFAGITNTVLFTNIDNAVVAAGLAVQSQWWSLWDTHLRPGNLSNSGLGLAQVSDSQMYKYSEFDPSLEGANQDNPSIAVKAMQARISMAVDACVQCKDGTDRLIVAALAQNGSEFVSESFINLPEKDGRIDWAYILEHQGGNPSQVEAQIRQDITKMNYGTEFMLKLYIQDLKVLMKLGYELPDVYADADFNYIDNLIP